MKGIVLSYENKEHEIEKKDIYNRENMKSFQNASLVYLSPTGEKKNAFRHKI